MSAVHVQDRQHEALEEADANLQFVHQGMQALLDLLDDSKPAKKVRAAALRTLLLPLADQVEQALQVMQVMMGDEVLAG